MLFISVIIIWFEFRSIGFDFWKGLLGAWLKMM